MSAARLWTIIMLVGNNQFLFLQLGTKQGMKLLTTICNDSLIKKKTFRRIDGTKYLKVNNWFREEMSRALAN